MANTFLLTDRNAVMENLNKIAAENAGEHRERVNGLMNADYVDCDVDNLTVTLEFHVRPWELNRAGFLHGGIICTMLDHTAAAAASAFTGSWCPTVDMYVRFISFGKPDDILIGTGRIVSAGKNIFHMEASLKNKTSGRLIATCTAAYLNIARQQSEGVNP